MGEAKIKKEEGYDITGVLYEIVRIYMAMNGLLKPEYGAEQYYDDLCKKAQSKSPDAEEAKKEIEYLTMSAILQSLPYAAGNDKSLPPGMKKVKTLKKPLSFSKKKKSAE